ncbi:MAG: hypothetical protein DA328_07715 [Nitrososphaeraceae archaeon]|nr:hypothetical protein [Nitrososphaeraceae archaeon]
MKSTRPHRIHRTDRKVEQKIVQIRKQYRYCSSRIKGILQNQYKIMIGHMIVYQIICRWFKQTFIKTQNQTQIHQI